MGNIQELVIVDIRGNGDFPACCLDYYDFIIDERF